MRKNYKLASSPTGFFLLYQIANSGFRTITASAIVDENKETIIPIAIHKPEHESSFGVTLKEGESISDYSGITIHGVELLGKAKKVYILDTAKRKYLAKVSVQVSTD